MNSFFTFLLITYDLNKIIKKNPTHTLIDIGQQETCAKFRQTILNCRVVGAQSFQILRQYTWFLKNNRALPKFLYGILLYLIGTIKLLRNYSVKTNIKLTTRTTFNIDNIKQYSVIISEKRKTGQARREEAFPPQN